jgi:hypothetical protein
VAESGWRPAGGGGERVLENGFGATCEANRGAVKRFYFFAHNPLKSLDSEK